VSGRATGPVARVQVAARKGTRCAVRTGKLRRAKRCGWIAGSGRARWSLTFGKRLPRGTYSVSVRTLDTRGKVLATTRKRVRVA
jgi:hypothetical protein